MAGAVVNVVVEQLILAAQHWVKEEISLLKGVKREIENMKNKMLIIQTVVEDAENQSVQNKIVKLWLEKLQDVSYDMDDVLDEWSTRVLVLKREEAEAEAEANNTCFSLKNLNCCSTVKQLTWRREIAKRIKNINGRIDSVFLDMEQFKLAKKVVGNADLKNKIINHIARLTTSFVDESKVYGRGDDKDFLLEKVLSMNNEQEKSLQVISIVGAGGLGKTTLAQMVYNDSKVKEKFGAKRIWVCVSDPFDEVKVARDILECLHIDHSKMNSLETLHRSVEQSLSGHKFLLVLDDVWDENSGKWEKLGICLKHGDPNSRIVVTTRKEKVATIMDTTPSNILKPRHISDSDCWFLMSRIAFQGRTNTDNELEVIGKKIAKKCKGLPLAAKTLGGMLIAEDSVDRWREILHSEIWKLEEAKVDLFPHIFLSYQELPAVLKRCFFILAIFPKDTEFKYKEVIAIWMAHGFLNPRTKEDDDIVTKGHKYLKFLVSRALLEEKKYSCISMHDIMHDFALHLSGDELISIDEIKNDIGSNSTSEGGSCLKSATARHLYIEGFMDPASIGFDVGKLRTFIIRKVAANVTLDLVKGLKMVRALYLVNCDLERVPPNIENLIHLRLLDLSENPLEELPETIGGLYNLQQLLLEGSQLRLKKFPQSVGKLINLRNLDRVKVGYGKNKLGLLKDLNQLRELKISFDSNYGDEVDAKEAAIEGKKHITELHLDFNYQEVTDGVISALQPHSNIQLLRMKHLNCDMLPSWITSLNHLTELDLSGGNASTLPPLGKLQSLKVLKISYFFALKMIGREFLGIDDPNNDEDFVAFPNLLELKIWGCASLREWEDLKAEDEGKVTVMPELQQLRIEDCRTLQVLPSRLLCGAASLEELSCININDSNNSLAENIKKDKQLLRHVKSVYVNKQQCSLHPSTKRGSDSDC